MFECNEVCFLSRGSYVFGVPHQQGKSKSHGRKSKSHQGSSGAKEQGATVFFGSLELLWPVSTRSRPCNGTTLSPPRQGQGMGLTESGSRGVLCAKGLPEPSAVLAYYDMSHPIKLTCDASPCGVGAKWWKTALRNQWLLPCKPCHGQSATMRR